MGAHPDDETFGPGGTLARYGAAGVKVVYACATRGEVGAADPEHLRGFASVGDMRWAELTCAARELGLAQVVHLGYRDSGMSGSPENRHPDALVMAPPQEVAGRVAAVIRHVRPQVVVTFDPLGGYGHPDHVAIHQATVRAFAAAGDRREFPGHGPAFAPSKLYYQVVPRRLLRLAVGVLPLLGRDPRRYGRNRDIDLVSLTGVSFPIHARIRLDREARARRERAAACHRSQLSGGPPRRGLAALVARVVRGTECYMRAHPAAGHQLREMDLFEGLG